MDGAIRFSGPDARSFLQGQLTNDMRALSPDKPLLAAHCNPQGRVVAVMTLLEDGADIVALLPASMVTRTMDKLRRYVLRAKVTMNDATADTFAQGIRQPDTTEFRLQDIAAGLPRIHAQTSETFVAQMLNLDLLGGISFDKGCYTGQEIVARAHYRGAVKRRMQRFRTLQPMELVPGSDGRLPDGRTFQVVLAAAAANGCCEFLAVAPLAGNAADTVGAVAVESLPLPYALSG